MLTERLGFAFLLFMIIPACSVNKKLEPMGGSRSDGTVTMGFDYSAFNEPIWNLSEGETQAKGICKGWGYDSAQSFGDAKQQCISRDGNGVCMRWRIFANFQCTTDGKIK